MKQFLATLPRNLMGCFSGRRVLWHIVAIALTFTLVTSGFDWSFLLATRSPALLRCMFPAVFLGMLVPLALTLTLLAHGVIAGDARATREGWAVVQAILLAMLIAATYKAVTGRPPPTRVAGADISHVFRFGWMRGGAFWGWPSSHTTVAFAMAVTMFTLCPQQRWVRWGALLYALYVGLGVSMTIHWFSDFAAGAIFGSVIGAVVGKSFSEIGG